MLAKRFGAHIVLSHFQLQRGPFTVFSLPPEIAPHPQLGFQRIFSLLTSHHNPNIMILSRLQASVFLHHPKRCNDGQADGIWFFVEIQLSWRINGGAENCEQ